MTTQYYADWRDVPEKLWRWPNFSPEEIACRGDSTIRINEAALDKLQALRDRLGVPLILSAGSINSTGPGGRRFLSICCRTASKGASAG